jgi:histone H3/H4
VRLVREIMHGITIGQNYHIQASALEALQEAAEAALVNEFECKYMIIWLICLLY